MENTFPGTILIVNLERFSRHSFFFETMLTVITLNFFIATKVNLAFLSMVREQNFKSLLIFNGNKA